MVNEFMSLSSGIRWAIFAVFIAIVLLCFEVSGMLGDITKNHPKWRKSFKIMFWVFLIITIFIAIVWLVNPNIDNTAEQFSNIQNTLNQMNETLKSIQQLLMK